MDKKTLVLYHADHDGFCAAFLLWLLLDGEVEYRAVQYAQDPPRIEDITNKHVYIVDFSYKKEIIIQMQAAAYSLLVFDHHKTASELCALPYCFFDMNKSGARLVYNFFADKLKAKYKSIHSIRTLVSYIEDRDLWKWEMEHSKEINTAIRSYPFDFEVWRCVFLEPNWQTQAFSDGCAILRSERRVVESLCGKSRMVRFDGCLVPAVNTPVFRSEVAGKLAEDNQFAIAWFQSSDGDFIYDLRSRGEVDVSEIAKKYGGGGHAKAAGFKIVGMILGSGH